MADRITSDPSLASLLPPTFLFGCSSASYQIEGGHLEDGKSLSVWDVVLKDKENGEQACRSYELWRDDVQLLKEYGCNTYRFSISWPRIKPLGGRGDPLNEAGIKFYSDLVDALIAQGIRPCITIFHWDHPQALEDRYGSFSSSEIVLDFVAYAEVLFERLGDRVKHWITINEPHIFTMLSSMVLKTDWANGRDHAVYARHLLLCHARTVELYRSKFQKVQNGTIGITLNCDWTEPLDKSEEAGKAAQLTLDWVLGFYAEPIYLGRFPKTVLDELGEDAPSFSDEEWAVVRGSSEFFGLNHYGTKYATGKRVDPSNAANPAVEWSFGQTEKVYEKDGQLIGVRGENGHPYMVPWGFRKLLRYLSELYAAPHKIPIWITENGFPVENEADLPLTEVIHDTIRQEYFASYIKEMLEAVRDDNILIGGYMAWSLLDNLEWAFGYRPRFGVTVVDRATGKRTPKDSAWVLRDIFAHALQKVA